MRIKLIYVPRLYTKNKFEYTETHNFTPPLGIAILTSMLKKFNIPVKQDDLDAKIFFDSYKEINKINLKIFDDKNRIEKFIKKPEDAELEEEAEKMLKKTKIEGYDVIGLSLCGQHNFSVIGTSVVLSKLIKEKTGATTIIGGIDKNECMIDFFQLVNFNYIDFVISGKGEEALLNLCFELDKKGEIKLKMENLFYRNMESAKIPPKICIKPWNFFRPDFDGLPLNLYRYNPYEEYKDLESSFKTNLKVLMLPYTFTFGCTNKCAFCSEYKCGFFCKRVPEVVEDLEFLKKKYKTKYFFFLVNNINPLYEYATKFVDEIIKKDLDIMWTACAHIGRLDKKLLYKFKSAGAVRLIYGLETASNRLLKYISKGFTREKAAKILKISHELGIWNEIELIAGLPFERDEDINSTVDFISQNREYINFCHPNKFMLKDSLFLKFPERFGLTNIKKITHSYYPHRFDEVNGLKWEEKIIQIEGSMKKLNEAISKNILSKGLRYYRPNSNVPFLLYFYTVLKYKKEVEKIIHFRELRKELNK
jgi:radical SAM superfamily enzyme YgiQ (UPF0313 family)